MDRLKKQRRPVRAALTKCITEVDAELLKEVSDHLLLGVYFKRLERTVNDLEHLDDEIALALVDANSTEEEQDEERQMVDEYRDRAEMYRMKINKVIEPTSPSPSVYSTANEGVKKKSFKLPKIELPKFNGKLQDWLGWWSQFEKIHRQEDLHQSDKFQYLIQATEDKTEARDIVKSFPPTGDNYELAIEALNKRYGREDLQLQVYLREILGLVINNAAKKEKIKLDKLYLSLRAALRALSTLNLSKAEPSMYFYPLVESSLPEDILRAWQRSPMSKEPGKEKLETLMKFLETEVEGEQQILLAKTGFSSEQDKHRDQKKKVNMDRDGIPTAAGLTASTVQECIFCDRKNHQSQSCFKAKKLTMEEKNQKVKAKSACFRCLAPGHMAKNCRSNVKCSKCGKGHATVMCFGEKKENTQQTEKEMQMTSEQPSFAISRHNNFSKNQTILLKTVVVRVAGPRGSKLVRMLIDEGSQVSYIGSRTVKTIGCKSVGVEHVKNMLLGGYVTDLHEEHLREVEVHHTKGTLSQKWILREKPVVCTGLPRVPVGDWLASLKQNKIQISDLENTRVDEVDIEILVGSDLRGSVMTGKRVDLGENLFAEETIFGWALGGPIPFSRSTLANVTISLFQQNIHKIQDMWELDAIGILDPIEVKSKAQELEEVQKHFLETVKRNEDGRYCVALPWIKEKPDLPSNKSIAEKRLHNITRKLNEKKSIEIYDGLFKSWEEEGLVDTVNEDNVETSHYLPHHPVFKPESKSTPVRPVFDASCKSVSNPSLNDCLYTGPNLIEQIPPVIHRFRERCIGVVSDIRKAFQMIEVREEDRDYQRFLWWTDLSQEEIKILRHSRVVFGVTSSPYLLGAVLNLHLSQSEGDENLIRQKLLRSMYVDNSVTSVDTEEEYRNFREVSTSVMMKAKMELRQWEVSGVSPSMTNEGCGLETDIVDWKTKVLGLVWDKRFDTLSIEVDRVVLEGPLTKRKILSVTAKVFDPVGVTCPATLQPKVMLQGIWKTKREWDEELEEEDVKGFQKWCQEICALAEIKIPRQMIFEPEDAQIHLFTDASAYAYGAVVFIRSRHGSEVRVQLVQAKSRVAPLKKGTIPRLELMGCLIGSRLLKMVVESIDVEIKKFTHWTDSTTALSWIQRSEEWGTFVANRVREIRESTSTEDWQHIPGEQNPADLPSRGCSPKLLLESKWWEGPRWLYHPEESWPSNQKEIDENEVSKELKGSKKTALLVTLKDPWFETKYSSYQMNVRVMGWIIRFLNNCREKHKNKEILCPRELKTAETKLLHCIQQDSLVPMIKELTTRMSVVLKDGLFCIKTKLLNKDDTDNFRWPVILPGNHQLVKMLIRDLHLAYGHPGIQFICCKLREKFWILGGRRAVKAVLHKCPRCRRFDARPIGVEPAALPIDRVTEGDVFQTTGVDLAGPVFIKGDKGENEKKAWIVLFTCAVYRCVHFDVVTSLSTEAFLGSLERFINMYGRPRTFFSDNGTNFVGTANLLKTLNWKKIEEKFNVDMIKWTFNPPAAPWWGGWWERLVRSMKDQLRRMLGKARLTYDELRTCLSGVQATINERPLTVVTEDSGDLIPITPAMFLHPSRNAQFPEGKLFCQPDLETSYKKMKRLLGQLQERFRNEYLSQLVQRSKGIKVPEVKLGEIVLIGSDNTKRYEWPIGKVIELIPGRDGHCRVAKVQTAHDYEMKKGKTGQMTVTKVKKGRVLTRPLQRLYPLEVSSDELVIPNEIKKMAQVEVAKLNPLVQENPIITRAGRQVKKPSRYGQWNHMCSRCN